MERRLHEAAREGRVDALLKLLQEDPLILDRVIVSCILETPLHVAAILGHIDFAKEILCLKPELASELDSKGSSPLHLASAKGYVEIVKDLLLVDPETCFARNEDGRTPLHLAAIKGRVSILSELILVKPEALLVQTDRGETVLHLCVKHNLFETLKLLIEPIQKVELVNWKDFDGNTVLHLAVAKKHIEMVRFLLTTTRVDVNAMNVNGLTALDILAQGPKDPKDMEIRESLQSAGAIRAMVTPPIVELDMAATTAHLVEGPSPIKSCSSKQLVKQQKAKQTDWLGRKKSALMVVASLIATVAFQAGLAPPGGVWQEERTTDSNGQPLGKPQLVGMSVMAYEHENVYGLFMSFNTFSFLASLSIILLLVSGLPLKKRRWMWIQMVIMWIAITSLAVTYFLALFKLTPKHAQQAFYWVIAISNLTWFGLLGFLCLVHVARVTLWSRTKVRKGKERERGPLVTVDDSHEDV